MLTIRQNRSRTARRQSPRCLDTVVIIGAGDVVQHRYRHAFHALANEHLLERVLYVDVKDRCPFPAGGDAESPLPGGEHYLRVGPEGVLPLEQMRRDGWLGPHALALVACPTAHHVCHAADLAATGTRTAVEKPLSHNLADARRLLAAAGEVLAIDHQIFKASALQFLATTKATGLPGAPAAIEFDLWETKGTEGRQIDPVIFDLAWHGLALALATLKAGGFAPAVRVTAAYVATYRSPDPFDNPAESTAARVEALADVDGYQVPLGLRVGKRLAEQRKGLTVRYHDGQPADVVDLGEGGWHAHGRVLRELLTRPQPDLRLSLADNVELVRLCHEARALAVNQGPYPAGVTPEFMTATAPTGRTSECYL